MNNEGLLRVKLSAFLTCTLLKTLFESQAVVVFPTFFSSGETLQSSVGLLVLTCRVRLIKKHAQGKEFLLMWLGWLRGYVHLLQLQAVGGAGPAFTVGAELSPVVPTQAGLPGSCLGLPKGLGRRELCSLRAEPVCWDPPASPAELLAGRQAVCLRRASMGALGLVLSVLLTGGSCPGNTAHAFPALACWPGLGRQLFVLLNSYPGELC